MMKGRPVRVPSKEAKDFKKAVVEICRRFEVKPFIGEVAVSLKVFRPRRVGDIDNTFKATFDALKGFAYNDDGQIAELTASRFEDKNNPRVEIQIRPLGLM
jgi:Holliday junction resolvase RusA-like endonuclease